MEFKFKKNKRFRLLMGRGFSLVELLVVIAIIGILSSIVLVSLNAVRGKAKEAKAESELTNIRDVIGIMSTDTGLWPNGCPVGDVVDTGNNEADLTTAEAGLLSVPPVGVVTVDCEWTVRAVSAWSGPYVTTPLVDPWDNAYWFDNDYYPRQDCPTPNANPSVEAIAAVVSLGENGTGGPDSGNYDCDDIYIEI